MSECFVFPLLSVDGPFYTNDLTMKVRAVFVTSHGCDKILSRAPFWLTVLQDWFYHGWEDVSFRSERLGRRSGRLTVR